jgi:hypothetical protein
MAWDPQLEIKNCKGLQRMFFDGLLLVPQNVNNATTMLIPDLVVP